MKNKYNQYRIKMHFTEKTMKNIKKEEFINKLLKRV